MHRPSRPPLRSPRPRLVARAVAALALASAALGQAPPTGPAVPLGPGTPVSPLRPVPQAFETWLVFRGQPGGPGRVEELHPRLLGRAPRELWSAVEWLDVDFAGRTHLHEFLPDRPRRLADVPGAARLVLPDAQGVLYRYRRAVAGGGPVFGFLHVAPDGAARVALERRGTGPALDLDPFVARIAVAPDGRALLVATTVAAGGDLLEVDLAEHEIVDRTPEPTAHALSAAGLWLNDTWGFGVAATGVLRFARAGGAVAAPVDFGATPPAWYSGEAVVSLARDAAATTAGEGLALQRAWVFGATGPAVAASPTEERLGGAGFLPETPGGPHLAVSDGGALCAWRRVTLDLEASNEGFLARVAPGRSAQPAQVTADDYMVDTLDEVGIIGFLVPDRVLMAVGERDPQSGVDDAELFEIALAPDGTPVHVNLSRTGAVGSDPFTGGVLEPQRAHQLAGGRVLVVDDDGERVVSVQSGAPGSTVLLTSVRSAAWVEPVGDAVLLALEREFDPRPFELWRAPLTVDAPATLVHAGSAATRYRDPVVAEGRLACVLSRLGGGDRLLRWSGASGLELAGRFSLQVSGPLAAGAAGDVLYEASEGAAGPRWYHWPVQGAGVQEVRQLDGAGHPLPGR